MSGWDEEDYEPPAPGGLVPKDKWEGEDSDDDNIKASWDQESDEEKSKGDETSESKATAAAAKKKKKRLADIIAAKEEARMAELEARAKQKAELDKLSTPEAKLEEKIRLQKMEEQANLELAKDMLGLKVSSGGLDAMYPETKEQFEAFEKAVGEKIQSLASSEHYSDFADKLIQRICIDLNVAALKKIKMTVEGLHSTKLKDEKATKKKPAAKGRTTVKMDLDKDLYGGNVGDYDDLDDFM